MELESYIQLKSSFVTRAMGEELVIVPLSENVAQMNSLFTLNETGKFIWENITPGITFGELVARIAAEFDVDPETARIDLTIFLTKLSNTLKV